VFTTCLGQSEADWLTYTQFAIGDTELVYVFLTNLPYQQTHGGTPSTNTTTPTSPIPPNATTSSKRFVGEAERIISANQTNFTIPEPSPTTTVPLPINLPQPEPGSVPMYPPVPTPTNLWYKALFLPTVDTLSLLQVLPLSYINYTTAYASWPILYPNLHVYLQVGNGTSSIQSTRKRFWATNQIIGSYSAIITLSGGYVVSLDWDDGCEECDSDRCLDNVCSLVPSTQCMAAMCDMKFYLAWVGTDKNGIYATSAGSLPSNFETFVYGTAYEQAARATQNNALTIINANN